MLTGKLVDHVADLKRLCPGSRYRTGSPVPTRAPDMSLAAYAALAQASTVAYQLCEARPANPPGATGNTPHHGHR